MSITLFGIVISVRLAHHINAYSAMFLTLSSFKEF
jgi:hypothetical protein